ncbi:putative hydrolase or acyltransferase of alpha/beta superfamily [Saccharomonospora marina XMU15]|uniref:Putative hydrolase or acyltransferase of alpha/beta superfamily n=1 Tax=Saccharomonospora marina XMU15 TaxID=882083 RepID=H5X0S6_9PSEU|nr:alpha/beta hydrolase [Saccharomonospora marina]EHR50872.1 putative hydrolase or acyltransferase of alpha/beta superfamily [Saccharomonospora marina XMU15]
MRQVRDPATARPARQRPREDGMPYFRVGSGPPLAFLPGLTPHHRQPRGRQRLFQLSQLKPLPSRHEVWWINRRPGLPPGVTMADLAADYASMLRERFAGPIDVLGVSTGGSIALQLAADHPDVVDRLVVVSAAHRLGPLGRAVAHEAATQLRAGRPRRANAALFTLLGTRPFGRRLLRGAGWLLGPAVFGTGDRDLVLTLEAEETFDIEDELPRITASTLVVGGALDPCYGAELFEHTAARMPNAELTLCGGKGHVGPQSRPVARAVRAFLAARPR